jgi:hypothetical protein
MKARYALLATLGLGLGLILALLWALGGPSVVHADPGVLCVAPGGTGCGGPCGACYASVQAAVDVAGTGDEIRIASGVYTGVQARAGVTQVVILTKTLTLSGGYTTTNWTTSDPVANPTTLDAEGQGRVMYITGNINPTVEGLRITGGDGSTGGDGGGGIAIREATAIIRNNVISDNVGSRLPTVEGNGGGISVITSTSPVLIYSNIIQANVSYSGTLIPPMVWGEGGGIAIGSAASAIITGNQILDNTAVQTDYPEAGGYGGGIHSVFADALTIQGNEIRGNLGVASGLRGYGGGILSYGTPVLNIADNTVIENTAIISGADASGGGMWLAAATTMTLTGNWVISNTAGVTVTANPSSYPNPWAGGGGIRIVGGLTANDILTMQDNHLIGNVTARTMTVSGTEGYVDGGGLNVQYITTTLIISNEVRGNTAVENLSLSGSGGRIGRPAGGGMFLYDNDTVTLSGNEVRDNITAKQQVVNGVSSNSWGGGIILAHAENATVSNNTVSGNTAVVTGSITSDTGEWYYAQGGGIMIACWNRPSCTLALAGNDILNNTAAYTITVGGSDARGRAYGGGLCISEVANTSFNGDTVSNNTALSFGSASGPNRVRAEGGGIMVGCWDRPNCTLALAGNDILNNTAAYTLTVSGSDARGGADGGGLSINEVANVSFNGDTVSNNTALGFGSASGPNNRIDANGGGIRIDGYDNLNDSVTVEDSRVTGNVAAGTMTTSGAGSMGHAEGGGLLVRNITTTLLTNSEVRGNTAVENLSLSGSGGWGGRPAGGGMFLGENDTVTLSGNEVRDNVTAKQQAVNGVGSGSEGGGIYLVNVEDATVSNNTVSTNVAVVTGSITSDTGEGYYSNGGGIMVGCWDKPSCTLSFADNDILTNTAAYTITVSGSDAHGGASGGGIALHRNVSATLQENTVSDNVAYQDAGPGDGVAGGGMEVNDSTVAMSQNRFLGNRSSQSGWGAPAVWVWEGSLTSTNDVFARNAGGVGAGAGGQDRPFSDMTLINDTFYDNGWVGVEANMTSTVYVTNTIVYGHDQGLSLNDPASTLIGGYNLLSNTVNYAGWAIPGTNDITGEDPLFLDAPNDDFHIASNSPAVDAGTSVGAPSVDFEDEPRPQGLGVDIGADEATWWVNYLPIIMKNY